jgi:3-methyl-2-oxobutanoate hydroxymethyltransferase
MSDPVKRFTIPDFRRRKRRQGGPPLTVLTAYDAPSAMTAEAGGVDAILVGDSLGNVLLGHETTLPVTMDEMIHHTRAVARVRRRALLIGDMPWMSYHVEPEQAVINAARFVQEAGADAVKLEGGIKRVPAVEAILDAEIPVMGHVGLTPQSVLAMGGFKVQGRREAEAEAIVESARALAEAGVFSIVLEGVPSELAARVTEEIDVPTIGIGAGGGCDGQVLVYHDLLGMLPEKSPKFVKRYAQVYEQSVDAIRRWAGDVREGVFPSESETYK